MNGSPIKNNIVGVLLPTEPLPSEQLHNVKLSVELRNSEGLMAFEHV